MDKYIGKRLGGRYDIKELIGVGGMANVYKAIDIIEDRIVAVKILKDEYLTNDEFLRRFRNESKAIAVLSHPNIVKIYDVSLGDGIQYLVMEYVDGLTLKEYIDQQHVLRWKEAVHFTVQILRALQHAHDKGIVHRDIKPHNIMLLQDGTIKVMDFGIARFARDDGRTVTDKAIGSVHYISPEQARGDVTDEKSDIYSVGVMLFEMLTGKLPFDSDSAVSIALMQMQAVPKMPRQLNETIPEGLEEITVRAMQKDPMQRYQSAAEMLRDIDEFKRNPSIVFEYKYFSDEEKTKYFDAVEDKTPVVEDFDEEEEEKKSKVIPILLAVASAFVIFVIAFIVIVMVGNGKKPDVEVPNLVGQVWDEIKNSTVYSVKIEMETTAENADYPAGQIFKQDPAAGSKKVKEGSVVKVWVSKGKGMKAVPDVTNLHYSEAKAQLINEGFEVNLMKSSDPTVEKDCVIKTQPEFGEQAEKGSTITVIYSTGPANDPIAVVSVVGETQSLAEQRLKGLGFDVLIQTEDSAEAKGKVLKQEPESGMAERGDTILLIVSSGTQKEKSVTIRVELPKNIKGNYNFTIMDYSGNKVTEKANWDVSYGDFDLAVVGTSGQKNYKLLVDNELFTEYTVDFDAGKSTEDETKRNEKVFKTSQSSSSASSSSSSESSSESDASSYFESHPIS